MTVKSTLTTLPLLLAVAHAMPVFAQDPIDESRTVAPNERVSIEVRRGEVRIQPSTDGVFRVSNSGVPTFLLSSLAQAATVSGTGVGTQFLATDMNGDGKVDLVLSNKKGSNLLLQK